MQIVRSRSGALLFGGLTSVLVVSGIIAGWHPRARSNPATGIVVVRGAPITAAKAVPLTPTSPNRVAPTAMPVEAAVADLRGAYPLLSEVAMECRAEQCSLTATIRPLVSQNDLDRRQEMLLGGLAAVLAQDGYRMAVPFDMDEVADNTFHIRAHVTAGNYP
ncbi:hypothetical protein [Sphingomonas sp. HMP9]|uniref:hypothetical protein n=1 Tax=Sphingomonas sp. HMP9 TaxID=1517554 RepID=UPI001596FECF|nr:hypothetical protein [Sphingomonas sp. HMP9]